MSFGDIFYGVSDTLRERGNRWHLAGYGANTLGWIFTGSKTNSFGKACHEEGESYYNAAGVFFLLGLALDVIPVVYCITAALVSGVFAAADHCLGNPDRGRCWGYYYDHPATHVVSTCLVALLCTTAALALLSVPNPFTTAVAGFAVVAGVAVLGCYTYQILASKETPGLDPDCHRI